MKTIKLVLVVFGLSVYSGLIAQGVAGHRFVIEGADQAFEENLTKNASVAVRVPVRAARDFEKYFEGRSVRWLQYGDTLVARFNADSATVFLGYGKNGRRLYTVRSYSEKFLPRPVRHDVRTQFYDYRINLIYEVQIAPFRTKSYVIYISDDQHNVKVVRWSDAGLEMVKDSKRQKA